MSHNKDIQGSEPTFDNIIDAEFGGESPNDERMFWKATENTLHNPDEGCKITFDTHDCCGKPVAFIFDEAGRGTVLSRDQIAFLGQAIVTEAVGFVGFDSEDGGRRAMIHANGVTLFSDDKDFILFLPEEILFQAFSFGWELVTASELEGK